ncbi:MAG: type II toxin-antitoxin system RelE/ParE family toxin [Planctomycetia bacterium]|nr:type II toxin-antitoxin system RelE/ParE family toxin [Planctomycetia bacterium]
MPASRVLFHRLAAREYRLARDWYRARSVEVAHRFAVAVDRAADRLAGDADALPVLRGAYRYSRVVRFPYVLVFRRLEADVVVVVAVAHTGRRPAYWRRRR